MASQSIGKTLAADRTIRIDSEVFKALQDRAEAFVDTPNTVLRKLLNLENPPAGSDGDTAKRGELWDLIQHGLLKPGDILVWHRARKGETFRVTVTPGGSMNHRGRTFTSPSRAANELGGGSNNGWILWRLGDLTLDDLRAKAAKS